jgi:hypothetical protein
MTKRETFFAILALVAGLFWGVAMSSAAASGVDHTSVAGWLTVDEGKPGDPAMFMLVDCHRGPCGEAYGYKLPDDAIRMTGRSGDAKDDERIKAWLVRHDGQRIRVTWTVEPKGAGR